MKMCIFLKAKAINKNVGVDISSDNLVLESDEKCLFILRSLTFDCRLLELEIRDYCILYFYVSYIIGLDD